VSPPQIFVVFHRTRPQGLPGGQTLSITIAFGKVVRPCFHGNRRFKGRIADSVPLYGILSGSLTRFRKTVKWSKPLSTAHRGFPPP